MLENELKKKRMKMPSETELLDLASRNGFTNAEQMYSGLGSGTISVNNLISKLSPRLEKEQPSMIRRFIDQARGVSKGIKIGGVENLMFRFASCCQPVPGEKIIGYVTRGRGLSIHKADCTNAAAIFQEPERMVDVEWDVEKGQSFLVRLHALVEDRKNLLKEITEAIAEADVNVRGGEISTGNWPASGRFVVEIQNYGQLGRVLAKMNKVNGVLSVERESGADQS
jgi:GTP pyrophosphokinase